MYEAAYQICEEESMLRAYLYACRRYMTAEEYRNHIQKSSVYQTMNDRIVAEVSEAEAKVSVLQYEDTLENWKHQYRRISTGEI